MNKKFTKVIAAFLSACIVFQAVPLHAQETQNSYIQNTPVNSIMLSEEAYKDYILGPGDLLECHIIVGDNALALDYELLVGNDGTIFFPNIGPIRLLGVSIENAGKKIKQEISKKFKENYTFSLTLKQPSLTRVYFGGDSYVPSLEKLEKFVYVYGDVQRSGRYNYFQGKTLSDYLNLAGGPSDRANLSNVTVTRNLDNNPQVFHINAYNVLYKGIKDKDVPIMAGDIINVPSNFFYFSDFASFASTIMTGIALYITVQNVIVKK